MEKEALKLILQNQAEMRADIKEIREKITNLKIKVYTIPATIVGVVTLLINYLTAR
jgi:actin-related protein